MRKGSSSLKKCNNVISVQHLRSSSHHGTIASIGPYLRELVISPSRAKHCASLHVSWELTQKTVQMSFVWPPLFVWIDGKLRYDRHLLSSRTLGYQQSNSLVELPLCPLLSASPKHLHIQFSQPGLVTSQRVETTSDSTRITQTVLWPDFWLLSPWPALSSRALYSVSSLLTLF